MKKLKGMAMLALSVFMLGSLSSCSTMKGKKCDCPRFGYEQPVQDTESVVAATEELGA